MNRTAFLIVLSCTPAPQDGDRLVALDMRDPYGQEIVSMAKPELREAWLQWRKEGTHEQDFEGAVHLIVAPNGTVLRIVPIPIEGGIPAEYALVTKAVERLQLPSTGLRFNASVLLVVRFPAKDNDLDPTIGRLRELMQK